jgi:H+/Cl- antiporter ClcA
MMMKISEFIIIAILGLALGLAGAIFIRAYKFNYIKNKMVKL